MEQDPKVVEYVSTHRPHICLLTPCYGGMCYTSYTSSLITTQTMCNQFQIPLTIMFCSNESLVTRARNNLVARALSKPDITHVLFVDADITWNPTDVLQLLLAHKMVVGGIYPKKKLRWDRLSESLERCQKKHAESPHYRNTPFSQSLEEALVDYNINVASPNETKTELSVVQNIAEVHHIPCGFMMIRREALETMQKAFPSTKYTDDTSNLTPTEQPFAYALFDCDVMDGHYLSEDWLFCERWKKMGGKVHAHISLSLSHSGYYTFAGNYFRGAIL